MEYVNCTLCDRDDVQVLFKKRDKFGITDDEFNVVECQRCRLLYVNPRPTQEEIRKYYPETYSWKETLAGHSFLTKGVRKLEKAYRYHLLKDEVAKVQKFTGRTFGKVLDIGCGTGDRLDVFRRIGFETYGVETSDSADYAKEYLKLNVWKGDLFSAHFREDFFDLVTMYNVLEHTHNPMEVCKEAYRILKGDGFLIIQVPNKDSIQGKLFKKRWAAFDVPRDLYYFGCETICSLLRKVGFHVFKVDHFMNWWHPPTLVVSLFPNLDPQKAWQAEEKRNSSIMKKLFWIGWTLILSPLTKLESLMEKGAVTTIYAMGKYLY